jgi:ABC-type Co2+ transport system permease subunit
MEQLDVKELGARIIKYVVEGLIVAIAAYFIPGKKLSLEEILTIGVIAAATFSVLDLFSPSIGSSARAGAGLGIGVNMVGGINPGPFLK